MIYLQKQRCCPTCQSAEPISLATAAILTKGDSTTYCVKLLFKMLPAPPVLLRLVASSVGVASYAGKIIRDIMSKGELGIVEKGINDHQTEADRQAQKCIIGNLSQQFPLAKIIGEEDLSGQSSTGFPVITESCAEILGLTCPEELTAIKEDDLVIWVDPLDGTAEYTAGMLDHVTVLIGVAFKDRPIAGIIHQPYYNYQKEGAVLGRTMWGIQGMGTGGLTPGSLPNNHRVVVTTRSHMSPIVAEALNALQPDEVIKVGGAGYKILLLLEGQASAYVYASAGCNKWDTCAPEAILSAVGGTLTDIHGVPYRYGADAEHGNKRGVLATASGVDHQWYMERIPPAVLKSLS